ncbi:hypothetical protein BJY18_003004 [Amycolatopsis jiangsuensis]|uniref:Uncharacterized protein n=1 Tax=Amycolatopsis jiangsuensis TaxID=1181879 RepID=A0A840IVH4_9PSEU|nr:hypothetical protein [Amycolatopsis jiangsuensis]
MTSPLTGDNSFQFGIPQRPRPGHRHSKAAAFQHCLVAFPRRPPDGTTPSSAELPDHQGPPPRRHRMASLPAWRFRTSNSHKEVPFQASSREGAYGEVRHRTLRHGSRTTSAEHSQPVRRRRAISGNHPPGTTCVSPQASAVPRRRR